MAQVDPRIMADFLRRYGDQIMREVVFGGSRYTDYARSEPPRAVNPIADGKRTIRMNRYSGGLGGAGYGAKAIDLPRSEWRWL